MRLLKAGLFLLIALQMIVIVPSGSAQRLYDKRRDEQAQAAKEYIEPLLSGAVFDAQLKNLALLSKQDLDVLLLGAQYEMRATVNAFIYWRDVNCYVARAKTEILKTDKQPSEAERAQLINELKEKIKAAKEELKVLQAEAACKKDPKKCQTPEEAKACELHPDPKPKSCEQPDATAVDSFFEGVGELEDLEKQIESLNTEALSPRVIEAGKKVKDVLSKLEEAYKNYRKRMQDYNALQGALLDMRITLKQVALQTLQVEEEHLKKVGEIRARRETQEAEVEKVILRYERLNKRLNLGYETDAKCFCSDSVGENGERRAQEICATAPDTDSIERNVEMTLRDAVGQARQAEALLPEAEETLQKAQRDLSEAEARRLEENERLQQAVQNSRGNARRRAERAQQRALQEFERQKSGLEDAIIRAQKNLNDAKQHILDTRDVLEGMLLTLHLATNLVTYATLPARVAKQREAQEEHAFSIRKSRVRARAYQLTVSTGVQRLALYHKGGIKPSLVARLIQGASTVAIPPILAVK